MKKNLKKMDEQGLKHLQQGPAVKIQLQEILFHIYVPIFKGMPKASYFLSLADKIN
jgi:hypothetical protein